MGGHPSDYSENNSIFRRINVISKVLEPVLRVRESSWATKASDRQEMEIPAEQINYVGYTLLFTAAELLKWIVCRYITVLSSHALQGEKKPCGTDKESKLGN